MPTGKHKKIKSSAAEYLTFIATDGDDQEAIEIRYEDENIWLTQKMMVTLYDISTATINQHLEKMFNNNELQEEATIRNSLIAQKEGSRSISRKTKHYNLQATIVVDFKVNNGHAV